MRIPARLILRPRIYIWLTRSRYALDITSLDEDVAAVLPEELRRNVADDLLDFVNILKTLRDQLSKVFHNDFKVIFMV